MSRATELDLRVAAWAARVLNKIRRKLGMRGRHRAWGFSTTAQVRAGW